MKLIKLLKVKNGTYKDRETGEDKNSYMQIGKLFQREDGSLSIKLDAVPINPEFNGWVNCFDLPSGQARKAAKAPEPSQPAPSNDDFQPDDIPF